ncbi:nuclear factor of activated T-cells 5-like [Bradysia coprophila]|uniref:nuclear factor of activated T-cells 5-like n=1 Tax=Bradysia coprophila TaxID=38358 RepID=UPI00187D9A1C|nr:nuclear factor of activated T-cells 5-like [Bradysia coprophila]
MTATDESNIGSLVSTSPSSFGFDVTPIEDINELTGDLFPNSPKQFYEDDVTDSSKVDEIRYDTHATDTETTTDNHITPDIEPFDDRTVEKLRISLPSTSPIWSSCYSSSSESSSSSRANKIRKRFCVACNQRFRKTSELHRHLLTHVTQPSVQLERLSPSNRYYQDFLKRQSSEAGEENTGLKIKLKVLSGAQNFEVIPNALDEANRGKGIRILTAKEIKLSPNRSPSTNTSPLDAMVALSEMTFSDNSSSNTSYMTDQDKVHFECPTLDGLDQFNEEVNKEAAAQLLKQLLETPQMPQENEWTPTNEYISIDRLAHMCPVCHSNFPDAVMLYEHKRITGHDFQNLFQQQQQQQQQQQSSMPNNGIQRPFLRPRAQTQLAVYGQPQLHQPNQNQFSHHQQPQQGGHMQQQDQVARYGVRFPMRPMAPQRRTPPPLYRPNGQAMPQGQPLNMAPFMGMSPDMYNPMPGANGMNNNTIMNSNAFPPNSRISPLQRSSPAKSVTTSTSVTAFNAQQQQQMGGHPQQQFNTQDDAATN